jgi:hypothetical protein
METSATSVPLKSSSWPAKIDWSIVTLWLIYFSTASGILYVIFRSVLGLR